MCTLILSSFASENTAATPYSTTLIGHPTYFLFAILEEKEFCK
jgi:hypothetical protein